MFIRETKKRSAIKAVSWRLVAFLNSWVVLSVGIGMSNILAALLMNISGLIIFYIFERIWNKIRYGRIIIKEKNK